ncbi:hypothetical protein IEQ34_006040 [Dendrobium chrysotoxum]|uniref:Uncharacterized protein n=1 Tax=Dendrobium chrysotoxum TaxID=161865 RepID=A0AAV7HBS6_DENCH|nr:hypothetical protein IEQ34_006040 [Dendrobium chrysotoxum]
MAAKGRVGGLHPAINDNNYLPLAIPGIIPHALRPIESEEFWGICRTVLEGGILPSGKSRDHLAISIDQAWLAGEEGVIRQERLIPTFSIFEELELFYCWLLNMNDMDLMMLNVNGVSNGQQKLSVN